MIQKQNCSEMLKASSFFNEKLIEFETSELKDS